MDGENGSEATVLEGVERSEFWCAEEAEGKAVLQTWAQEELVDEE
jgi:hypothetical protein